MLQRRVTVTKVLHPKLVRRLGCGGWLGGAGGHEYMSWDCQRRWCAFQHRQQQQSEDLSSTPAVATPLTTLPTSSLGEATETKDTDMSAAQTSKLTTTPLPTIPSPEVVAKAAEMLHFPFTFVDTPEVLENVASLLSTSSQVAVDVEACVTHDVSSHRLGAISLIQLCIPSARTVFVVDVLTLGKDKVVAALRPSFESTTVEKLFFDCRRDVEALSTQLQLPLSNVLDLQLMYTGILWQWKSIYRRFGLGVVLKAVASESKQDSDAAVRLAMTRGNRPVWDIRPLPQHFLEYAAGDVKQIGMLATILLETFGATHADGSRRLTAEYVSLYGASGKPVEVEVDPSPAEVTQLWLERFFGSGGVCAFCKQRGHSEADCFRKAKGVTQCSHCGSSGHVAKNCFKRFPNLLKCDKCGQIGHKSDRCFRANPCRHCGGTHDSSNCHRRQQSIRK